MPCVNADVGCTNKAKWQYTARNGADIQLCDVCKDAFELGQMNPDLELEEIK